jgi:hypothetical protein
VTNLTSLLDALHGEWPTLPGAHHSITIRDEALQGAKLKEPLTLLIATGPGRSPRTFFVSDEDLSRPPSEVIATLHMLSQEEFLTRTKRKRRGRNKRKE